MSYLFLCVLCSANCKDASEENSVNEFTLDILALENYMSQSMFAVECRCLKI